MARPKREFSKTKQGHYGDCAVYKALRQYKRLNEILRTQ
ncbi:hypothetical protein LCGC14_1946980, partial [marine sediment metagenome]